MALSFASHAVVPCPQSSLGNSQQLLFQTRLFHNAQSLTHYSSYHVLQCIRLSKSIIRASGADNPSENSRVMNEASHSDSISQNSRLRNDASNSESSSEASNFPARRTYRKPLASLRVTGEALPMQVNAALAADGGRTAAQELAKGRPMLVIETYNPGRFSEGSSVSTKLEAPTLAVLKRAKSMGKHELQFSSSGRAFAIAFQAVRLLKLSKFELSFFKPGTMDEYKEGEVVAFLEVLDASILSEIAKSVCSYALACVKDHADRRIHRKKKLMTAVDSSVVRISTLTESEVMKHVEVIVEEKGLVGASAGARRQRAWWERPLGTQSVVKTGVDPLLVDEFVPAHALEFKLLSNNFETVGLQKTSKSSCRIDLTHAQMMDLADVFDLYCGDPYTGSGENVSISIDIPRRSWSRALVWGAFACVFGGALVFGMLSIRKSRGPVEAPPSGKSIFEEAFSQKFRELTEGEPIGEESEPVDEAAVVAEPTETEGRSVDEGDLAEQNDESVHQNPPKVSFRGRSQ